MHSRIAICIGLALLMGACSRNERPLTDREYVHAIDQWHSNRIQNLKKESGWLNLIGLFWLKPGPNLFGSDPSCRVVLPASKAAPICGTLFLQNGQVYIDVNEDIPVLSDGKRVRRMRAWTDSDSATSHFELGSLRWFIIKRDDRYGVRLRDLESPAVTDFKGVERFPVDVRWRLEARWEAYDPPRTVLVPTILGTTDTSESPGALVFDVDGDTYRLEPIGRSTDESLFVIFGDRTNGRETYGGGRYLYVSQPDSAGRVIVDFNKAYNPPCVFTEFATCPFPPAQNKLQIAITAGEKMYGTH